MMIQEDRRKDEFNLSLLEMITTNDIEEQCTKKIIAEDELSNETVIYDNGFEQAIAGGSIVVHIKGKK